MTLIELGNKIRNARTLKKMTQKQLGKIIGVGESTVRMWELGKNKPSPEILKKLSKSLDVPLYELMAIAGYMDNKTLIDVMISELGATAIEIDGAKMLVSDYENKAKKAKKNDVTEKGFTAEEFLADRDKLLKHIKAMQNRQDEIMKKIYKVPGSENILFDFFIGANKNTPNNEVNSKYLKDLYFDFFNLDMNDYALFYKGVEISRTDISDITKFIETFIINKKGD